MRNERENLAVINSIETKKKRNKEAHKHQDFHFRESEKLKDIEARRKHCLDE